MNKEIEILIAAITKAARMAFQKLFSNGEHFYYCALLTTGEGFAPVISAWSWEALARVTQLNSETYAQSIKWSYADSPYYAFYNPQIEMFARFKMKSSFHKTKRII